LRASALYAVKVTGRSSQVVDGELEGRYYQPLGRHVVWAAATRWIQTASLQNSSAMPQAYWIELGGEGSVRGVERSDIIAVDGGRTGLNVRSELRLRAGGFGGVLFWDRAGVWRELNQADWSSMTDGYGFGVRYDLGIPLRLDVGWSEDFNSREIYFSIGQAF
jgi:outer membrane translocation and assembly module TamA